MNVDQQTSVSRWSDFIHPDRHRAQDHEGTCAGEEAKDDELRRGISAAFCPMPLNDTRWVRTIATLTLPANKAPLRTVMSALTPIAALRPQWSAK